MDIDFSKIYSYSRLNSFDNCPKQYYFSYLDPEISSIKKYFKKQRDYQTKGSAVHDAITLFHHLKEQERTFKNLKECLLRAWFSEKDSKQKPPLGELGGFESLEHERRVYRESLVLLKNFFQMERDQPSIFYLPRKNLKKSFDDYQEMIKPLIGDISISGKFDRIDILENGNLKIIDYKTGKNENDNSQLYFYKLLTEINFDKKVSLVSFYYLEGKKIKDFDVLRVDNQKIKEQILGKIEKIENTQDFLIKKTGLCNYCDFKVICPAYNSLDKINKKIEEIKKIINNQ